jgi:(p)ppGpp synthase/HD superfamily hydrolase
MDKTDTENQELLDEVYLMNEVKSALERGFRRSEFEMYRSKVLMQALRWHRDQKYGDFPYSYHIFGVEQLVYNMGGSQKARILALLHDVLEDVLEVTLSEIIALTDEETYLSLLKLKHFKGRETYEEYIDRLLDSKDEDVYLVKFADSLFNLRGDKSHMERWKAERLNAKYAKNLALLAPLIARSLS